MKLWQKISLILFGLFLTIVILEIGLRIGGFAILSMQEHRNLQSIKQKGACRIMCLGESTTQGQYPHYLEEVLNQRNVGIKFSVIDKGLVGTTTAVILSELEANLDKYQPDMVIAMLGINDEGYHMPYEAASTSKIILTLRSFKTYKLARLLWLHIVTKYNSREIHKQQGFFQQKQAFRKAIGFNSKNDSTYMGLGWFYRNHGKLAKSKRAFKKAIELNPENDSAYIGLGWCYIYQGKLTKSKRAFKKAIELNPKNDAAYIGLGWFYKGQGKLAESERAFKKAIELNPNSDSAYRELGWLYKDQGKLTETEEMLKKVIELNPKNGSAYIGLGWLYRGQGKLTEAEEMLKKAIELNPKNDAAYIGLGWLYKGQGKLANSEQAFKKAIELNSNSVSAYRELGWLYEGQGKLAEAEEILKKDIEFNPNRDSAYRELGWFYRGQGKLAEAEEMLKKAIELNPDNERLYENLAMVYSDMGNNELSKIYAEKVNSLRNKYYSFVTINHYHMLKQILDKRKIKLICVQYPMRSVALLKRIFKEEMEDNIIFVDNERVFKDAVKREGYKEYFKDMFGGDFGHCTEKGNRLLAENIANVILKEAFNKK